MIYVNGVASSSGVILKPSATVRNTAKNCADVNTIPDHVYTEVARLTIGEKITGAITISVTFTNSAACLYKFLENGVLIGTADVNPGAAQAHTVTVNTNNVSGGANSIASGDYFALMVEGNTGTVNITTISISPTFDIDASNISAT
ncbi:MAG: hypothetical protein ABSF21_00020 [Dehalococcoidia bacterium]